ncbi:STAS domain-containing protein [Bhargavaea ullalensis]|uniref:RsbT co-antagonist protein RsbR n=1 Tax=Bhargavaea ullalensis TaxID=1265685 RepID=A0ABV2GEL9_9BACL
MAELNLPLPLPYLKINRDGTIVSHSSLAGEQFDLRSGRIESIIDEESIKKLNQFSWLPEKEPITLELNLKTRENPLALFDVHLQWEADEHAAMVFVPKDPANEPLTQKLMAIQTRLAATDFALLEKKEELERVLRRLDERSGPFIPLTDTVCMIPLFGDITAGKIRVISRGCLQSVFEGDYETVLFDLTAAGDVDAAGIEMFIQLVKSLNLITGQPIKLVGIKPNLAKALPPHQLEQWVEFNHSIKEELRIHLNH